MTCQLSWFQHPQRFGNCFCSLYQVDKSYNVCPLEELLIDIGLDTLYQGSGQSPSDEPWNIVTFFFSNTAFRTMLWLVHGRAQSCSITGDVNEGLSVRETLSCIRLMSCIAKRSCELVVQFGPNFSLRTQSTEFLHNVLILSLFFPWRRGGGV
jgi:hypothetical protein